MKKDLTEIFDMASPGELEELINANPLPCHDKNLNTSKIKKHVRKQCGIKKNTARIIYTRIAVAAACICIAVGMVIISGIKSNEANTYSPECSPETLLNSNILNKIIWSYKGNIADNAPGEDIAMLYPSHFSPEEKINWNGVYVAANVAYYLENNQGDEVLAIKAISISEPEVSLDDYIYNGKSYSDMCAERDAIKELTKKCIRIKSVSNNFSKLVNDKKEQTLITLINDVGEDLVYRCFKDGTFDQDAVRDLLIQCIYDDQANDKLIDECKNAYIAEYMPIPDFTHLNNQMIVKYSKSQVIFVSIAEFQNLTNEMKQVFSDKVINNTLLMLAAPSDLGISDVILTHPDQADRTEPAHRTQVYPEPTEVPSTSHNPITPDGMIPVPDVVETLVPQLTEPIPEPLPEE